MQVKDLIKQLSYMNSEAEVHFSYNYGDHWRTKVAPNIANVEQGFVGYSSYHNMDKMLDEDEVFPDEESGNPDENAREVVILT